MSISYDAIIQRLSAAANKPTSRAEKGKFAHVCALVSNPQLRFQSIHVAGTNGKGTTVCKIASCLMQEKRKVGVYTSPHISAFEERIAINGARISKEAVERSFQPVFELEERFHISLSYFEYITLASFLYFAEQQCDVVVVETGLGGRFDATNVVDPLVSVITSISLDHTQLLGNTIEEITYEKAGIIKENKPCVIGPCVPYDLVEPYAQKLKSPLYQVTGTFANFEEENSAIAAKVVELLGVSPEASRKGLQACPPCRFEKVHRNELSCDVVLDVAHNPQAIERLLERLENEFPQKPIIAIYGASKDKDYKTCIQKLANKCQELTFVAASYHRAAREEELLQAADSIGVKVPYAFSCVEEALHNGIVQAKKCEGVVVVCGTFYIMDEVARLLLMFK